MVANGQIPTSNLSALPNSWSNKGRDEYLRKDAYESLSRALNRAVADSGANFQIYDAYRSLAEQVSILKEYYYAVRGGRRPGDRSYNGTTYRRRAGKPAAASPGYSNHGTGLAIDLHSTAIQNWFKSNGRAYGWTWDEGKRLGEDWHFVYNPALDQYQSEGLLDHAKIQEVVGANVDGKIGTGTIALIKKWQADHGLTADGKVGPSTKSAMLGGAVADTSEKTIPVVADNSYEIEYHQTKNLIPNRKREDEQGTLKEIAIHHWGSDGQKFDNVVNWLVADGNGNNNSSAHEVIEGGRVAVLADYKDGTWNSGTRAGNLNNYGLELRPEADDATIRTAAARIKAARDHAGKDLPLVPHQAYKSTACPGRYMDLLAVLDRLARGEEVAVSVDKGTYTAPAPSLDGRDLAVDGRWGSATSQEIQTRIGVRADGKMGPVSWKRLQEVLGTVADGVISSQSHRASDLGNGISENGWQYTGPGSKGSKAIVALQKELKVTADGLVGPNTIKALQKRLNRDEKFLTVVVDTRSEADGRFGTDTVSAGQRFLNARGAGLKVDGKAGKNFWKALQKYLGTPVDGEVSSQRYKAEDLGNGITQGWDYDGANARGSSMVRALQKWIGASVDGIWGEETTQKFQIKLISMGYPLG